MIRLSIQAPHPPAKLVLPVPMVAAFGLMLPGCGVLISVHAHRNVAFSQTHNDW
jgi:hypothetical protein